MDDAAVKSDLLRYLQGAREAVMWKLDGLADYDIRRPLVRTGTNLLGLIKHLAGIEAGYFGQTFGRPFEVAMPWTQDGAERNADMWATADQSREWVVDLYQKAASHSDSTISALSLDDGGVVPWWPAERQQVSLHQVLVHVIAETQRHAGHADILREMIDGSAGLRKGNENLASGDADWWESYRAQLEDTAQSFSGR